MTIEKRELEDLENLAKRFIIDYESYTEEQKGLIILRSKLEEEIEAIEIRKTRLVNLIDSINAKLFEKDKQKGNGGNDAD